MLKVAKIFLCAGMVLLASSSVLAQTPPERGARGERVREASERRAATAAENRENVLERRQNFQQRRIQHGIRRGFLTPEEASALQAEQREIENLAESFKGDGRITRDEARELRTALNEASVHIWAQKHDTTGNQMPSYRLGKNVYANAELTAALENADITNEQARSILKDMHRTLRLKHALATADLSDTERAKMQAEYDDLLNKYFEVR